MNDEKVPYKYVGPYGRKRQPAMCSGIGTFYHGDVIMVPKGMEGKLAPDHWIKADRLCQYERLDGKICGSPDRLPDSPFCKLHHEEIFGTDEGQEQQQEPKSEAKEEKKKRRS